MENENKPVKPSQENAQGKNNNRRGHHGRHNRSKGYFITPTQEGEAKAAGGQHPPRQEKKLHAEQKPKPQQKQNSAPNAKASASQNVEGSVQKSGGRNNHRRRRGQEGNHAQKSNAEQVQHVERTQNATAAKENQNPPMPRQEKNVSESTQKMPPEATHGRAHGRHSRHQTPNYGNLRLRETLEEPQVRMIDEDEPEEESTDIALISPDVLETPRSIPVIDESIPRVEVVGIRFKSTGKTYYFDPAGKTYTCGGAAIVETARGLEYGEIAMANTKVKETDVVPPLRPILREATKNDRARHEENRKKEAEAFRVCNRKIAEHKLDMKLIDAQYTFDNSKLLFYFTSAGRVDFRELVKDLASVFRTRIELRQIGIRDEAKMMGGLGMCGRPLCCSVFLSDFCQVSIKMAKEQNFSLNSSKISGICGRLMCCLRFEHETYEYEIKRTPPVDSLVQTPDGNGIVIENSPLAGTVKVRLSVTPEVAPKVYHRDDVVVLLKKQSGGNNGNNGKSTKGTENKNNENKSDEKGDLL